MERISVLIADDEETIRDTVAAVVNSEPDLEVVGQARDTQSAIELASQCQPDVAIVDVRMPGGGGPMATREIIRRSPPTRVLALSAHQDAATVLSMLRAGAMGYLVKDDSTQKIIDAVHRCIGEEPTISETVSSGVAIALAEELHGILHQDPERERRRWWVRRVLDEGRIRMVFQPVFELGSGVAAGVEALARIDADPHRSADRWFADAAAVGLQQELELAAIEKALAVLGRLPRSLFLSFNVSPDTAMSPELEALLRTCGLDRVVMELTEHAPVGDYGELSEALAPLRLDGLRLAVDDAGAGFASMRHILLLKPDLVKLDSTLVHNVDQDEVRRAVITALNAFASQIHATVVAEGVETEAELDTLRSLGVGLAQGFFLGRPRSIPATGQALWNPPALHVDGAGVET